MIKLILCLVITITSSFVGFSFSHRLYKRKEVLEQFVLELKNALTQVRYSTDSLAKIFSKKFNGYFFDDETDFFVQWLKMLKIYENELSKKDIEMLSSFAKNLGTSDLDGEINNLNMYIELLNNSIKEAQNNINLKSKLYRTLGMSFGLALSIMLF